MDSPNFSLQQSLQTAAGQVDPFAKAKLQDQRQQLQSQQVMDSPFPDMVMGAPMQAPTAAPAPSLKEVSQPIADLKFPDLAKKFGISMQGLSQNRELGGLQLLKRMQSTFGPNFNQHEAFQPLMKAWNAHTSQGNERELMVKNSQADRTLKALLGV